MTVDWSVAWFVVWPLAAVSGGLLACCTKTEMKPVIVPHDILVNVSERSCTRVHPENPRIVTLVCKTEGIDVIVALTIEEWAAVRLRTQ